MVTVFFVVVVVMGLDFKLLTLGLLPNISGKKSDAVAEFFAGNPWPKGKALESSQSGIAFSIISDHSVADHIQSLTGKIGVLFVAIGFIATA